MTFGTVYGDYNTAGIGVGASKVPEAQLGLGQGACASASRATDIDCSRRVCPKGNGVMDERLDLTTALTRRRP